MSTTSSPGRPEGARRFAAPGQKVPPFARFKGTSAWKKDRRRAREYARYRAVLSAASQAIGTPNG